MSSQRFSLEFKEEVVWRMVDNGCAVYERSEQLGIFAPSLCKSVKAVKTDKTEQQPA
ncbi:MAG: hypothetical protein ABW119_23140 [Candidatus Thiodiazotropha lotti]